MGIGGSEKCQTFKKERRATKTRREWDKGKVDFRTFKKFSTLDPPKI